MKILIDANVAVTYISGRDDPYSSEIEKIMRLCAEDRIEGVIAFHSLSIIWYISRKVPDPVRRQWMRLLCGLLTVSGADNALIREAIDRTDFKDFEDALQDCCAVKAGADYIVTVNRKDYLNHSVIPAVTPEEFLRIIRFDET
ncbi:MAG: PIN domain-containing protein [Clostridia bacterium]|nr:PIN domain-containing protein [Clostridia bacterium]